MKIFITLWLLTGLVYSSFSQIITIKDSETLKPVELATLMCENPGVFATTNADGQADISVFAQSEKITIHSLGYKTETISYPDLVKNQFEVLLTVSFTQLDELVVSASRWTQNSKNIPSRIVSLSPKEVVLNNPQTAADLLGLSGEVFIQKSQQGGGSPMIRGFSTNRLLYTIDGVRMNSAIFRSGNIQNVISLDPFAIENTEIFFGPGSIIYGSDAIGGVMSFQTLTPQFSLPDKNQVSGKAISRYSSANNEVTNHFDINAGGKKWAAITSLTHSKYGDLRMGKNGPDEYVKHFYVQRLDSLDRVFDNPDPRIQNPSGYSQMNMMQKIRYSPNRKWDLQYGFHYSETSAYSRYDRLIETQENGLPVSAVWNYGPQVWMMNNLMVTSDSKNRLFDRMTLRLAHQYFQESRIDRRFNHFRLRTNLEEVQAYTANADFEKSINKHRLFYGVEYVLNEVTSTGSAEDIRNGQSINVPDRYPASLWKSYAGYVNYQYVVSEIFLIQAGTRYSGFKIESDFTRHLTFYPFNFTNSEVKNAATTGSLGLVYTPSDTWKFSVNGSTGFRAPNVDDIGKIFDFAEGEVIVPNTSLHAEYAYNGEFGISKIFDDAVKLDVTCFYTYLDKAMVRRAFQVNGQDSILYDGQMSKVYAIQNAAYGTVYGLSAGIECKLPSGFSISSRYNFQSGKEETDNGDLSPSRHASPAFGHTRISYRKDKLLMQFFAMYNGEVKFKNLNPEEQSKPFIYAKDADGNPYSPGWYTLHFKAMYQFHENLEISGGIENITDQRYRPYSSGLVAPGRNFILSLRADF
jgi:hemoglobin/transferrin/lactoferrin receptor protein